MAPFARTVHAALNLVMPHECLRCGKSDEWLCNLCVAAFPYTIEQTCVLCHRVTPDGETHGTCLAETYLDGVIVTTRKNATLQRAIHLFKYHHARGLARVFAYMMTQTIERLPIIATRFLSADSTLVPLPLHPRREWDRGYNHAALIAHAFAEAWPLRVREDILVRTRNTKPQAQLSRAARLGNVKDSFTPSPNVGMLPHSVILVDDVMTTGSTMNDAARALKHAGVHSIWGLVLVRE